MIIFNGLYRIINQTDMKRKQISTCRCFFINRYDGSIYNKVDYSAFWHWNISIHDYHLHFSQYVFFSSFVIIRLREKKIRNYVFVYKLQKNYTQRTRRKKSDGHCERKKEKKKKAKNQS